MFFEQYKVVETLQIIKQIESEGCKNTIHKSDAIGCYGLRPMALKDIGINKIPFKYPVKLQHEHALKYAKKILSYSYNPTEDFLVYAWLNGPIAARKLQKSCKYGIIPYRNCFKDHWYNKRYDKLKTTQGTSTYASFPSYEFLLFSQKVSY